MGLGVSYLGFHDFMISLGFRCIYVYLLVYFFICGLQGALMVFKNRRGFLKPSFFKKPYSQLQF